MLAIDTDNLDLAQEHMAAIDVLRVAKNAFLWLATAAVLLHLAAFVFVFSRGEDFDTFGPWPDRIDQSLAIAGFVARAGVLVINGIFLISLLVCLSARMGGAAAMARGSVFALASLAMVTPWINASDSPALTSALSGGSAIYRYIAGDATLGFIGVVRFIVCPAIVVALLLGAQWSYRRAYRKMTLAPPARLPIHEV